MNSTNSPKRLLRFSYFAAVTVLTWLIVFPLRGACFQWWQHQAVLWMFTLLGLGLVWLILSRQQMMMASFAACALLCLHLENPEGNPPPGRTAPAFARIAIAQLQLPEDFTPQQDLPCLRPALEADLLVVEINAQLAAWRAALEDSGYRYRSTHLPHLHIFSRLSFDEVRPVVSQYPLKNIAGRLYLKTGYARKTVQFVVPVLPETDPSGALAQLAGRVRDIETPLLVFGRYHRAPWSREVRGFQQSSGLWIARATPPRQALETVGAAPVDHIFYNDYFKCISFGTISGAGHPNIGVVGAFELLTEPTTDAETSHPKL